MPSSYYKQIGYFIVSEIFFNLRKKIKPIDDEYVLCYKGVDKDKKIIDKYNYNVQDLYENT